MICTALRSPSSDCCNSEAGLSISCHISSEHSATETQRQGMGVPAGLPMLSHLSPHQLHGILMCSAVNWAPFVDTPSAVHTLA